MSNFSFHSVLQELFVVFLGALLHCLIFNSYSHHLTEEEFIPRMQGMCGEGCGKRGRGRVPGRVDLRERKGVA